MRPFSISTLVLSRPISSTFAARPVATSITSARISSVLPPSGPTSTQTPSFSLETALGSKRAFVTTFTPRRVKLRSRSLLMSLSSAGTMAGRYSRSVTWLPMSWKKLANSTPTAPAPTMTMPVGAASRRRMSSLVRIFLPSGVRPGSDLTREPVATMTSPACRRRSPPPPGLPSSPGWLTRTRPAPSRRPRPSTNATLFLVTRLFRPVHIRFTTWSRRAAICA